MQAIHTASDPRSADDVAAAFAVAPPVSFAKPSLWPGPEASATTARLLWDEQRLYIAYAVEGSFAEAIEPSRCDESALETLKNAYDPDYEDPRLQRCVMLDDRVEVFLQPELPGGAELPQSYFAFEINKAGVSLPTPTPGRRSPPAQRVASLSDSVTVRVGEQRGR